MSQHQTLLIGDIHACYDELIALLTKANLDATDEVIAVGDIVDRGPKNVEVFEFFRANGSATPKRRVVRGNHENKHILANEGKCDPAISQLITYQQMGESLHAEFLAWCATLPFYIDLPEVLAVHGYWEPTVPLERQRLQVLVGSLGGYRHIERNYEKPQGKKWYEMYDGPKPLVCAHHNYTGNDQPLKVSQSPFFPDIATDFPYPQHTVIGLDTSCAVGGYLTGLLLPSWKFIQVPSKQDYWHPIKEAFKSGK